MRIRPDADPVSSDAAETVARAADVATTSRATVADQAPEDADHPVPQREQDDAANAGSTTTSPRGDSENMAVYLARIGWLATVIACLIAVLILVLQGYFGYAGVTLAVAISAAINLT